jgi:hypothetical protein
MKRSTSGKTVTIYGQTEVTRDLMDARNAAGLPTVFEAENVELSGFDTDKPSVSYVKDGALREGPERGAIFPIFSSAVPRSPNGLRSRCA